MLAGAVQADASLMFADVYGMAWSRGSSPAPTAMKATSCQVEGCMADLTLEDKPYCMKKRICSEHMRAEVVLRPGYEEPYRFCFQCGKLEPLAMFDGGKRSCRARLQRRKLPPRRSASWTAGCSSVSSDTSALHGHDQLQFGAPIGLHQQQQQNPFGYNLSQAMKLEHVSAPLAGPGTLERSPAAQQLLKLQQQQRLIEQQQRLLEEELVRQAAAFSISGSGASVASGHGALAPACGAEGAGLRSGSCELPSAGPQAARVGNGLHPSMLPAGLACQSASPHAFTPLASVSEGQACMLPQPAQLLLQQGSTQWPSAFPAASAAPAAPAGWGFGGAGLALPPAVLAAAGSCVRSETASPSLSDAVMADDGNDGGHDPIAAELDRIMAAELSAAFPALPHPAHAAAAPQQQLGGAPAAGAGSPSVLDSQSVGNSGPQLAATAAAATAGGLHNMRPAGAAAAGALGAAGAAGPSEADQMAKYQWLQQRQEQLHVLLGSVQELYQNVRDLSASFVAPDGSGGPASAAPSGSNTTASAAATAAAAFTMPGAMVGQAGGGPAHLL